MTIITDIVRKQNIHVNDVCIARPSLHIDEENLQFRDNLSQSVTSWNKAFLRTLFVLPPSRPSKSLRALKHHL